MRKGYIALVLAIPLLLAPQAPLRAEDLKGHELLGVRIGGVVGSPALHDVFGAGSELEIYFIEGLGSWWGIGLSLSSHNFGASRDTLGNIRYTGLNREVKLSIFSMAVALYAARHAGGRFTVTGEGGCGLYAMTASIPAGLFEGTRTENRFGLYGGTGMLYRISRSLSLDLNVKYHYVFVGSDELEPVHAYTGETRAGFFQIAVGILFFTM